MINDNDKKNNSYILRLIMRQVLYSVLYIHYFCKVSVRCHFPSFAHEISKAQGSSVQPNSSQTCNLIRPSFLRQENIMESV